MNKLVCMALTLLLALSCTLTRTQGSGAAKSGTVNPENYPYFYVMDIRQVETDTSSAIMLSGCFGDFKATEDKAEPDLDVLGFDEEHPVELRLKDTCEVLLPEDFGDNIMVNLPCKDILQWYTAKNEGETDPLTFYAVLTLDESNQVTKLEYQYFPWG
jgi:hypothetical protein